MKEIDLLASISKYYPIGVNKSEPDYYGFPGFELLLKKIEDKMSVEQYAGKWKPLVKSFKVYFPEIIRATCETMLLDV